MNGRVRILAMIAVLLAPGARAAGADDAAPAVNYISADAVYLNVGSYAGLAAGMTVSVVRSGATIATLEVVHVSSHSASCRIVDQVEPPAVGDAVVFSPGAPPPEPRRMTSAGGVEPSPSAAARRSSAGSLRGVVGVDSYWQEDFTGSGLSSLQPSIFARVSVKDVAGTGGELRFRGRTRLTRRDEPPGPGFDTNQWSHRLTEFAVVFDHPDATVQWAVGRLVAPHMRGVGLVDGGYAAVRVHPYWRIGGAGGLEPDPIDTGFDSGRRQVAGFVAFEYDADRRWRFASTAAFAGSYAEGEIDREFWYLQNVFSLTRRLTVYQSVEADVNRGWRKDAAGGDRIELTNLYLMANAELSRFALVDFTYDNRKNVRTYDTMESPDSLFDDRVYSGWGAGVTLRLPRNVTLRGSGGIRHRKDDFETSRRFSVVARVSRFPWAGHSLLARYAWYETQFTTAWRPVLTYRFPATAGLRVDVSGGGYIYERGTTTTSSYYAEAGGYYRFGRYFTAATWRQYAGGDLESAQVFAEVGLNL